MKSLRRPAISIMKWKLLPALLGVFLAHTALATVPLYLNTDVLQYMIPGVPPPPIDATAFDNENTFTVGFEAYTPYPELYETWNTVNYTNVGLMVANSPTATNGAFFFGLSGSFGSGFQFDQQTTNLISRKLAGTFYNPGDVRCDSTQDGNNIFTIDFGGGLVFQFYLVTSLGQCKVAATNIINPGTIDVGTGGLIQMNGRNVDLTGGQLTVEALLNSLFILGPVNFFNTFSTATFNSFGTVGVNTNFLWNPKASLTAVSAVSSYSPYPYILSLSNSTSYFDDQPDPFNANTIVHRAVFLVNYSPDNSVTANVYFDPLTSYSQFGSFYPGCVNVGWSANTTDPATGNPVNNYLYLTDDYVWGALTNAVVIGGVPDNFVFSTSSSQVLFGPASSGFVNEFPDTYITNRYAYMNGTLTASSVNTNASGVNPSGTITNLPGAIKITASSELNMAYATIAGPNYLSLNCTNQFDGSPGASISSPYSDIYLGVTNGFMTVSNLLMAAIPDYSGNIQAWSTRWTMVDTNAGVTNDFRVLLVYSALQPSTPPWIQNLYLHGTNSLVISDHLNVYGSFYSDARRLTLITNVLGNGETSLDGELNWFNPAVFNANSASGTQQMPNLRWLTNNGAFLAANTANFGQPLAVAVPSLAAVAATGTLSEILLPGNVVKNDRVIIGTNQYIFVGVLTNKAANQIMIGTTFDGTMGNLIAAINHATGSGSTYSTNTRANPLARAGSLVSHAFTVTALTAGAAGNSIVTLFTPATAAVNLTWNGFGTLTGGANAVPATTNGTFALSSFINHSLIADQGTAIWTTNFLNDGTVSNGTGSFSLQSMTALLTNGNVVAGGDVTLVATNRLLISNHMIQAGRKLTLISTNITDTGVTNGNIWVVGANGVGGTLDSGFNIPVMPRVGAGDLLGTTVTNIAPPSKSIYNVWAGTNFGLSTRGYTNNLALGQLILDARSSSAVVGLTPPSFFYFNGVGVSNALYVDRLILMDSATNSYNTTNTYNFQWLKIGTNMVIYYAQALKNGVSVAEAIDNASRNQGANGGRLRWIYSYAGYFSSTNLVYPDGTTNTVNAALAGSSTIDSDGDGIPNNVDPTPFLVSSQVAFTATLTNLPPLSVKVLWATIPQATNFIYYTTNLVTPNWLAFTNFKNWYYGNNVSRTNAAHSNNFISPQAYINNASLPDNSQNTNVWVFDVVTNVPHYYQVVIWPWLNFGE
jgi:hypothetical protein